MLCISAAYAATRAVPFLCNDQYDIQTETNRSWQNSASHSSTLEIVERFDIDLKFAGSPWSAPDFFNDGSTSAVLKHIGNFPSWNDWLANREITTANWSAHAFSKDVGTMSSDDDLAGIFTSNLWTSAAVTGLKLSSDGSLYDLSATAVVLYTSSSLLSCHWCASAYQRKTGWVLERRAIRPTTTSRWIDSSGWKLTIR